MLVCENCSCELRLDQNYCPKCGQQTPSGRITPGGSVVGGTAALEATMTGSVGPLLIENRFEVIQEIGKGGFGVVYKVRDRQLDVEKALKLPHAAVISNPEILERFQREMRILLRLNHQCIVPLRDTGLHLGVPYYTMDFCEGRTARQALAEDGPFSLDRTLAVAKDVLGALDYAHRRQVLHRDLKPVNIMLVATAFREEARILDFGIGRILQAGLMEMTTGIGTPTYSPPEQFSEEGSLDHRADIYSVAATLHELLSGAPPFQGKSTYEVIRKVQEERPRDLCELRPELPRKFVQAIERALAKNPAKRFSSAQHFLEALDEGAGTLAQRTLFSTAAPAPRVARRHLVLPALLVLAAALGGYFLWSVLGKGQGPDGTRSGMPGAGASQGAPIWTRHPDHLLARLAPGEADRVVVRWTSPDDKSQVGKPMDLSRVVAASGGWELRLADLAEPPWVLRSSLEDGRYELDAYQGQRLLRTVVVHLDRIRPDLRPSVAAQWVSVGAGDTPRLRARDAGPASFEVTDASAPPHEASALTVTANGQPLALVDGTVQVSELTAAVLLAAEDRAGNRTEWMLLPKVSVEAKAAGWPQNGAAQERLGFSLTIPAEVLDEQVVRYAIETRARLLAEGGAAPLPPEGQLDSDTLQFVLVLQPGWNDLKVSIGEATRTGRWFHAPVAPGSEALETEAYYTADPGPALRAWVDEIEIPPGVALQVSEQQSRFAAFVVAPGHETRGWPDLAPGDYRIGRAFGPTPEWLEENGQHATFGTPPPWSPVRWRDLIIDREAPVLRSDDRTLQPLDVLFDREVTFEVLDQSPLLAEPLVALESEGVRVEGRRVSVDPGVSRLALRVSDRAGNQREYTLEVRAHPEVEWLDSGRPLVLTGEPVARFDLRGADDEIDVYVSLWPGEEQLVPATAGGSYEIRIPNETTREVVVRSQFRAYPDVPGASRVLDRLRVEHRLPRSAPEEIAAVAPAEDAPVETFAVSLEETRGRFRLRFQNGATGRYETWTLPSSVEHVEPEDPAVWQGHRLDAFPCLLKVTTRTSAGHGENTIMCLIPGGTASDGTPVAPFLMDRDEVSVARFIPYKESHELRSEGWSKYFVAADQGVSMPLVTIAEARGFADFCGKDLPDDREWEVAAFQGPASEDHLYPFGDERRAEVTIHQDLVPTGGADWDVSPSGVRGMATGLMEHCLPRGATGSILAGGTTHAQGLRVLRRLRLTGGSGPIRDAETLESIHETMARPTSEALLGERSKPDRFRSEYVGMRCSIRLTKES